MGKRGDRRKGGSRSKPAQTNTAQHNRDSTNEKGPPSEQLISAPTVLQTGIGPKEDQPAAEKKENNSSQAPSDLLLVKYTKSLRNWTGGLVLVGFLTIVMLTLQWLTFEKTDETARAGLRPYISGVDLSADIDRFPSYWALKVILENSGGTPPTQMRYVIRASSDFPLDPEDIFQHPSDTDAFFETNVAPKGKIRIEAGGPPVTFFDAKKEWYISGAIHYRDQFHGTPERISKFCFAVLSVKEPKTNVARPGYDPCPYWNCIDEKACANDRARYDNAIRKGEIRPTKKSTDRPDMPIGTAIPSAHGMLIKALP